MNIAQINKIRIPKPSGFSISYNLFINKKLNFAYGKIALIILKNCIVKMQLNFNSFPNQKQINFTNNALKTSYIKTFKLSIYQIEFLLRVKDNTE